MDNSNYRTDCFAYKGRLCTAMTAMNCDNCKFYKPKGTECDTCPKKGKDSCNHCRR